MKKSIICLLAALMLPWMACETFAWGQKGHRIIAGVAYHYLTPKARKQVNHILGQNGGVYWSTWPDEVKSDTVGLYKDRFDWHFNDLDAGQSDSIVADYLVHYPLEGGQLFRKLDSLKLAQMTDKTNHDNLVYIIHLTGDRHCPVHMAHMDDLGGNKVKMKWFGQNTNLHAIWDSKLIDYQGYSYSEYVQRLIDVYDNQHSAIVAMSERETLLDLYHTTEAIYDYQKIFDGDSYHYAYRWTKTAERYLYMAGARLAEVLNSIYK